MEQSYLSSLFEYRDGQLFWKSRKNSPRFNGRFAGKRAGRLHKRTGYWEVGIDYKLRPVARVIWTLFNGSIPDHMVVDHIDCDPLNNRIENLRLAAGCQNLWNHGPNRQNSTGVKNVHRAASGRFEVRIWVNRVDHCFGSFATVEEAAAVADRERSRLHGEFARAA